MPHIGDILYHGSTVTVSDIDPGKGFSNRDFGQGFYTTTVKEQAVKFAHLKAKRAALREACVSVFQYEHNDALDIKIFTKADMEWLLFILKNRKQMSVDTRQYDIVAGPVADDAVGLVLNQLMIGTYGNPDTTEARQTAIRLLNTKKLYNQVFFGTREAVRCLKFIEGEQFEIEKRNN